jgi:hypothetical protein
MGKYEAWIEKVGFKEILEGYGKEFEVTWTEWDTPDLLMKEEGRKDAWGLFQWVAKMINRYYEGKDCPGYDITCCGEDEEDELTGGDIEDLLESAEWKWRENQEEYKIERIRKNFERIKDYCILDRETIERIDADVKHPEGEYVEFRWIGRRDYGDI